MKKAYLGVDVGSVSTNMVVADEKGEILESLYIRTMGQPVK
ncbi:MAG: 2-hydroxyglutaryl-CoA dehydratase, partial [Clostridia bacterium]|nr:2-hydroxyglutaryl-CoA dehydratase [Clostridia bacterium]